MMLMYTLSALLRIFLIFMGNSQLPDSTSLMQTENKPVLQTIYKTNSWFSSAYSFPSSPIFALPSSYKFTNQGIEISSHEPVVSEGSIVTGHNPACLLSFGSGIRSTNVKGYGDWNVVVEVNDNDNNLWEVYITQGSPELYLKGNGNIKFNCGDGSIHQTNNRRFIFQQGNSEYRVLTLPLDVGIPSNWNRVTNTYITKSQSNGKWITKYNWVNENDQSVLTTLWPHQLNSDIEINSSDSPPEPIGMYKTHIGELSLFNLENITTTVNYPELEFDFEPVANSQRQQEVRNIIVEDANQIYSEQPAEGVYFRGIWLGKLTTLIQLSNAYNLRETKEKLLDVLQTELEESASMTRYDEEKKMLIYARPEFGHEEGNDHHFHYGYYLRAMSVLIKERPNLKSKFINVGNEMALDIANINRNSTKYPFLRNYSVYNGHSWADGDANFGDGNNQESTSEAMNAWYGLYMWGKSTNQNQFEEAGSWLYSQELTGTKAYWFGDNNPFPEGYAHDLSAIVWGGKRDFGTWFSGQLMHIYGIELLPITPASEYLSTITNAQEHFTEMKNELLNSSHEWEDLYVAYLSYHNPAEAVEELKNITQFKGAHIKSVIYHTVYKNAEVK